MSSPEALDAIAEVAAARASAFSTLADLLQEHALSRPSETAAVCGETRLTYAELRERVARLVTVLEQEGVGRGSRVLWIGRNCHRLLETMLACAGLEAVCCPANWRNSIAEQEFVVQDSDPAVVLWEQATLGEAADELREVGGAASWIQHDGGGAHGYEALVAAAAPSARASTTSSTAPAVLMYTAAFGGRPNGALLTHVGLIAHSAVMQWAHRISHETICLNSAPLFHIGGLYHLLTTFQAGGCNVFIPLADPEAICKAVTEDRCTIAYLVEPTVARIVELAAEASYDLRSLRTRSFGPAWDSLVTVDDAPRAREPNAYGQTELSGLVTLACLGGTGPHGRPIPFAQVRIVDDEGEDVPVGEPGEIVVRGPTVMAGYHNRPELNDERFRDGWYRTNDRAVREADGSISFVGPKGRLIKSAKENIYPQEVEACLKRHPAVDDCAVIGVPDPVFEQSVKAIVVLRAGATVRDDELIEHCREHLASYKKPRSLVFAESLPRSGSGIDYGAVDRAYGGGGYPGA